MSTSSCRRRRQRGRAVRRATQFRLQGELWRRGWPMQNFPPRETSWWSAPSAERPHGEAADPLPRKGAFQADSMRFERPPDGWVGKWTLGFWQAAFPPLLHHPATSQPHPPDRKPTRRMCEHPGVVKLSYGWVVGPRSTSEPPLNDGSSLVHNPRTPWATHMPP